MCLAHHHLRDQQQQQQQQIRFDHKNTSQGIQYIHTYVCMYVCLTVHGEQAVANEGVNPSMN